VAALLVAALTAAVVGGVLAGGRVVEHHRASPKALRT
jgi:hypothetical protein